MSRVACVLGQQRLSEMPVPALSVSLQARSSGTGSRSQQGPLPWNRPGPAGLRGAQPPICPGGRDRQAPGHTVLAKVTCFICSGCGLHFELPCLLANSATATSCQHMSPVTDSLAPVCPTYLTQCPPAQRSLWVQSLPGPHGHSPSPLQTPWGPGQLCPPGLQLILPNPQ